MSYVLAAGLLVAFFVLGLLTGHYTKTVRIAVVGLAILGPAFFYLTS